MTDLSYFTCTLGEAALVDNCRLFTDIAHLLRLQAENRGNFPAVGFLCPPRQGLKQWAHKVLSYNKIWRGSLLVAQRLSDVLHSSPKATVGLICGSSADFLFTLLACIQLGHAVLLIAPQCSPSAVAHLCKNCTVKELLHDDNYASLAKESAISSQELQAEFECHLLPWTGKREILDLIEDDLHGDFYRPDIAETDIAYLHHTSGTSSGIPKPVAQSHRAVVGVLPALDGSKAASFTTTPLYHGGIADVFRTWTSSALIWLFPETRLPVTATNVIQCLRVAREASTTENLPVVKYFSSVPFVLQQLAEIDQGLVWLKEMDLVGVGGAALPEQVGNELVDQNVKLVSRYGSVENGFLMSSHRDYDKDKDWQYLRRDPRVKQLILERKEDFLHELVIEPGWPHIAKTNREDGSYATSDLFTPHSQIPNAWKYNSRADSQIILITGKKFDPAPMEDALRAASSKLTDVLIFGNGEIYPGALLFRSERAKELSDQQILDDVDGAIQRLNKQNSKHARLLHRMLKPMPYSQKPLAKSSKGTILRDQAQNQYSTTMKEVYENSNFDSKCNATNGEVEFELLRLVQALVDADHEPPLTSETDLFDYGVDSVISIQIRYEMMRLLPKTTSPLPLTIVEDAGTVSRLAEIIIQKRNGLAIEKREDHKALIPDLVKMYSQFRYMKQDTKGQMSNLDNKEKQDFSGLKILLTGSTGFLGVHILSQILARSDVAHVYLLLRGKSHHAARERVLKAMASHCLPVPENFNDKVTILTGKLSEVRLGLSASEYHRVAQSIDLVLHLAWSVNFLLSLRNFNQHLAGVKNLINIALSSPKSVPPRFVFCSSVASVSNFNSIESCIDEVPESITGVQDCGSTGYAQSKLTAELICAEAAKSTRMQGRITIIRVGQLSGDSKHGIWNVSEAYPLILSTAKLTGCLPDLGEDEHLTWLPVDAAANCFIEAALNSDVHQGDTASINVLHLGNFVTSLRFIDFLHLLKQRESFEIVSADNWLSQLDQIERNRHQENHPSLKLLPFWKNTYRYRARSNEAIHLSECKNGNNNPHATAYGLTNSLSVMPSLRSHLGSLDNAYLWTLWNRVKVDVT